VVTQREEEVVAVEVARAEQRVRTAIPVAA